jgi:hypothetical protein
MTFIINKCCVSIHARTVCRCIALTAITAENCVAPFDGGKCLENITSQNICSVLFSIQATLVIRNLTLRVFAITRFRGEKNHEKIV